MGRISRKARIFWPLLLCVFLSDCTTKRAAVEHLSPPGTPHEVLGDEVRFTLAFNEGTALGLPVSREVRAGLGLFAVLAAGAMFLWYVRAPVRGMLLPAALALIIAGALGNGWERIVSSRGVVDFIDLGLGSYRFYVFNIADIGVTVGALLLAVVFWREDREVNQTTAVPGLDSGTLSP